MTTIELTDHWIVQAADGTEAIPARVPGNIHFDLLRAGRIPDPCLADNEKQVQWVGETDWIYRCGFRADDALLSHERILLRCEGLDALATITVNGQEVGRADNMFRTWEFDLKPLLRSGDNRLEIRFASAARWGVFMHFLTETDTTVDEWNRTVDGFDVEALAAQLAEVGAGYYFITPGPGLGALLRAERNLLRPELEARLATGARGVRHRLARRQPAAQHRPRSGRGGAGRVHAPHAGTGRFE